MTTEKTIVSRGTLSPDEISKIEFLQATDPWIARNDYSFYVRKCLGLDYAAINDPRVLENLDKKSEVLLEWQMYGQNKPTYTKVLEVRPRDTGKSTTLTVPAPSFLHLGDRDIAVGVMTATMEGMADKFGRAIRSTFEGEMENCRLTEMFGVFHAPGSKRTWTTETMVTDMRVATSRPDGTVQMYSIASGPTSGHFNAFIIDDPTTEETLEKDSRWDEKVWNAYSRMPFVVVRGGLLWIIMTRTSDNDLCGRIIREEIEPAVRARIQLGAPEGELPADWDYETGWIKYAHLAGWTVFYDGVYANYNENTKTGDVLYPTIWPEERIQEVRRTKKGEQYFWTHLMNRPSQRDDAPIKKEDIEAARMHSIDEVPIQAKRCVDIHCDFAFKNLDSYIHARDDRTVAFACGKHIGHVYCVDGYSGYPSQDEFGDELIKMMYRLLDGGFRVRAVTFDKLRGYGSGDESAKKWLRSIIGKHPDLRMPTFDALERTKNKWEKIMATVGPWQEGQVHVLEGVQGSDALYYQMQRIYYADHDDEADAFSDAFHPNWATASEVKRSGGDPNAHRSIPAVHGAYDRITGAFRAVRTPKTIGGNSRNRGGGGRW